MGTAIVSKTKYNLNTMILNPSTYGTLTISGTTTGSYTIQPSIGTYFASSSSVGLEFGKPYGMPENTGIEITFKDGGTTIITMKDYCIFINLHGMSPSECTKAEYEEKSLGMRI